MRSIHEYHKNGLQRMNKEKNAGLDLAKDRNRIIYEGGCFKSADPAFYLGRFFGTSR
jgi:hypothetical protein